MALQVWLPLNGTFSNNGISQAIVNVNNGLSFIDGGKLGQCASFNGSNQYINFTNLNINGLSEISFCIWCCPATTALNGLFLVRQNSANHQINLANGVSYRDSVNTSSLRNVSGNFNIVANTWTHLAFVYKAGSWYLYQNGILTNSYIYNGTATLLTNLNEIRLGLASSSSGNVYFQGLINDFRIYNNALSSKEVKKISKGLILHYPLDVADTVSPGYEQLEYIIANNGSGADLGYPTTATMSYEFKYSVLNGSGWRAPFGVYESANHIATRILLDSNNQNTFLIYHYSKAGGGGKPIISNVTTGWDQIIEGFLTPTAYQLNNLSTGNSFTGTPGQISGTVTQRHLHLGNVHGVSGGNFKIYYLRVLWDNKLQHYYVPCKRLSDNALGFFDIIEKVFYPKTTTQGTFTAGPKETNAIIINNINTIYDTSGYCNNSTVVGTLAAVTETPRYQSAISFSNGRYLKKTDFQFTSNSWTISCWFKKTSAVTNTFESILALSRGDGTDTNKKFSVYIKNDAVGFVGQASSHSSIATIDKTLWHHICVTSDGATHKYYLDGILQNSYVNSTNLTNCTDFVIGARAAVEDAASIAVPFGGYISDVRLYCTALSTDDVKELYETSMDIDSAGNISPRVLTA